MLPSCCCSLFALLSIILGVVAVILSFTGKSPGSEAFTMTGMICGFAGIGLSVLGALLMCLFMGMGAGGNFNQGFNQGFNNGFNQNRNFNNPPGPGGRRF